MRLSILGLILLGAGGVAIATGLLPAEDAIGVWDRVWPVLVFAAAVTVVAELAADAGVFTAVAERLARAGARRAWVLWVLVVLMSVVSTVFLSLDTTAVLLTPVVVIVARHHGLDPLPFALTTVWLANTGSLLLPVSNLTNLLAMEPLGHPDPASFAALMALPSIVAIGVPVLVLAIVFRRQLGARFEPVATTRAQDGVLFWISASVVVALIPLLVSGIPVWIPACAAAVILLAAFAIRRRGAVRLGLVPWGIVLFACGLFLVVETAHSMGLTTALEAAVGSGDGPLGLLSVAASGALGANAINNLPAYLALEPVADSPQRIAALLVGVNAGALITPWASLATLLWHQRLVSLGVDMPWRRYVLLGLLVVPITVTLGALAILGTTLPA